MAPGIPICTCQDEYFTIPQSDLSISCYPCSNIDKDCIRCSVNSQDNTETCLECRYEYLAPGHDGTTCEMKDVAC